MKTKHERSMIEIITGPMFSGKTTKLLQRCSQAQHTGLTYQIFKPAIDTRYATCEVVSHSGLRAECMPVEQPLHILQAVSSNTNFITIDEAQLFGDAKELAFVGHILANAGRRVIIAGLDTDKWGLPFIWITALGSQITQTYLTATCAVCNGPARLTQCLLSEPNSSEYGQRINIGGPEKYEPRCGSCHQTPIAARAL